MWKYFVEPDRLQMTISCMRIGCWVPRSTDTYSEYIKITAFLMKQWLQEHASLLRHNTFPALLTLKSIAFFCFSNTH